jgi:hypothetical protein
MPGIDPGAPGGVPVAAWVGVGGAGVEPGAVNVDAAPVGEGAAGLIGR